MRTAQFSYREIIALLRRRKKFFILPVMLCTVLSIVGALLLPSKYESSTTILVQRDEILNPLMSFDLAVTMASEDRLKTFNEIIFSQSTMQELIDSLGLGKSVVTEAQRQALVEALRLNITIETRGSDSFRITYVDTDPRRAQEAAALLARIFIRTKLRVEGKRNEEAVEFYQGKLEELRQKYESSQKEYVALIEKRLSTAPTESKSLYTQLESVEGQLREIDLRIKAHQHALDVLQTLPSSLHTENGRQGLFDILRDDLPLASDVRTLLGKYEDYLRRYTPKYPEVGKLESELLELLERMKGSVRSSLTQQQSLWRETDQRHTAMLEQIKKSSVSEKVDEDKESDYGVYHKLYDEMKVKLEQAETARDLGNQEQNQFEIIDPAIAPATPSKPHRGQLAAAGFGLGLFLGFLTVIVVEMLDSKLRYPRDVEVYEKPIIAFIPEGNHHSKKMLT